MHIPIENDNPKLAKETVAQSWAVTSYIYLVTFTGATFWENSYKSKISGFSSG